MDKIDNKRHIPLITALKVGHHVIDKATSFPPINKSCYGLDAAGRLEIVRVLVEGMTREPFSDAGISLLNYVDPWHGGEESVRWHVREITNMKEVFMEDNLNLVYNSHTPLQLACAKGDMEVVKILLAAGAEVNKGNRSPLYLASSNGHLEVVKFLTERGADINIAYMGNNIPLSLDPLADVISTPLYIACFNKHFKIINFLIDAGAKLYEEYNIYNDKMNPFKIIIDEINYRRIPSVFDPSGDILYVKECWKIIEYVLRKYDPCISLGTMTSSNGATYALNHPEETKEEKLTRWRIEEICDQIENERIAVFEVVKFAKIQKLTNKETEYEALYTNRINGVTEHIFKYL